MASFKPINSDESNLFHIRCLVSYSDSTYTFPTTDTNINIGGGIKTEADTGTTTWGNKMRTPTTNNLPDYFGIHLYIDVSENEEKYNYYMNYGVDFAKAPTVKVTPLVHNLDTSNNAVDKITGDADSTGIVFAQVDMHSNTCYKKGSSHTIISKAAIDAGYYNVKFKFYKLFNDASNVATLQIPDTTDYFGFIVDIVGPLKYGVTTGNTNRGWNLAAGNRPTSVSTNMNVGIGTGNPSRQLSVMGNLDAPFKFCRKLATSNISSSTVTLNATLTDAACMYNNIIVVSHNVDVTLTSRTASEIYKDMKNLFKFTPKTGFSFDLTVVNLMSSNTVTMAAPSDVTGSPASTHSTSGNLVISASSTGVFKFWFSDINDSVYNSGNNHPSFTYTLLRMN